MSKLIMMRGLPASGKTTKAKEMVEKYGNFVRVSRDNLREMLHFGKWTGKNEGVTVTAQTALVHALLEAGKCVIIDDTNLGKNHKKKWSEMAEKVGAGFAVSAMDTPYTECIRRDEDRVANGVGAHVIYNMALQYDLIEPKPTIVICDIDGTLAGIDHRLHFVRGKEKKDWSSFFSEIENDTFRTEVWTQVVKTVGFVADSEQTHVVLVSARPEKYRQVTRSWLAENGLMQGAGDAYQSIIMRPDGDGRDDEIIKQEIYDRYLKHHKVVKVFDDRPRVIRMWRENGLEVVDCGSGVEF